MFYPEGQVKELLKDIFGPLATILGVLFGFDLHDQALELSNAVGALVGAAGFTYMTARGIYRDIKGKEEEPEPEL